MIKTFKNIASIPELRKRLLITFALIVVFRIGSYITLPGINTSILEKIAQQQAGGILDWIGLLTGGRLQDLTIFGLGVMPYISASIMFQLLIKVIPALEALSKEGAAGYRKIRQYERYATVGICLIQAAFIISWASGLQIEGDSVVINSSFSWKLTAIMAITAGTIFVMWLGEQIGEFGIGNGISMIIMTGIISRMPAAFWDFWRNIVSAWKSQGDVAGEAFKAVVFIALYVGVIVGVVLITQGQRRIPVQQAKQARGRRIYGGQRYYLPLRVNQGGVMPVIFAQSLLVLPVGFLSQIPGLSVIERIFAFGSFWYILVYIVMILFFEYFWTALTFNPTDMAEQLKERGNFIPGIRPGKNTAEMLEYITNRIALAGGIFLSFIAIFPQVVSSALRIPMGISAFLGGTGILIVVGVALELVQQVESQLLVRHYEGFMRTPVRGR
ncbi:MAG: preprotein translocase subunit SecY [Planctomycetota bacterium]